MKVFDIGVEPVGFIAIGVVPRGVIAIGPLATGVVAIGQIARGFIAIGQLAIGVLSIGQLSVGMWWASGQLAMAPVGGPAMLRLAPFGTAHPIRWIVVIRCGGKLVDQRPVGDWPHQHSSSSRSQCSSGSWR